MRVALLSILGALLFHPAAFAQTIAKCPRFAGYPPDLWAGVRFVGNSPKPLILAEVIDMAARILREKAKRNVKACVVGFADNVGHKNYDVSLARARVLAVVSELVRNGLLIEDVVVSSGRETLEILFAQGRLRLDGINTSDVIIFLFPVSDLHAAR